MNSTDDDVARDIEKCRAMFRALLDRAVEDGFPPHLLVEDGEEPYRPTRKQDEGLTMSNVRWGRVVTATVVLGLSVSVLLWLCYG